MNDRIKCILRKLPVYILTVSQGSHDELRIPDRLCMPEREVVKNDGFVALLPEASVSDRTYIPCPTGDKHFHRYYCTLRGQRSEMRINERKNAAAYHVRRSAVKNVQVTNSGIARTRLASPAQTNPIGRRITNKMVKMTKNPISCGFIVTDNTLWFLITPPRPLPSVPSQEVFLPS